jgi:hypothetical protein
VCRSERRDSAGRAVTSLLPARRIPGFGDAHLSLTMSPRQHLPFPAPAVLSAPSTLPLPSHPASTSAPHSSRTPVPPRVHTAAAPSSRALPYLSCPIAAAYITLPYSPFISQCYCTQLCIFNECIALVMHLKVKDRLARNMENYRGRPDIQATT